MESFWLGPGPGSSQNYGESLKREKKEDAQRTRPAPPDVLQAVRGERTFACLAASGPQPTVESHSLTT